MKCPNCGADMKPGTIVCLNCGHNINDDIIGDDFSLDNGYSFESKKSPPIKKKSNSKFYIILIVLFSISFIILMVDVIYRRGNNNINPAPPRMEKNSITVKMDNYTITVPKGFDYQVEDKNIYISDGEVYNFSFRLVNGNYEDYTKDLGVLTSRLTDSGYKIKSSTKKVIDSREITLFTLMFDDDDKYLYFTKCDSDNFVMGIISVHNRGSIDGIYSTIFRVVDSVKVKSNVGTASMREIEGLLK